MSILGAALIPHPPLIIPEVGRGHEKAIQNTIDACKTALQQLAALQPDPLIISRTGSRHLDPLVFSQAILAGL